MDQVQDLQTNLPSGQPGQARPKRARPILQDIWAVLRGLAIGVNIVIAVLIITALIVAGRSYSGFQEDLVQSGPKTDKIVIVPLQGIIDGKQAEQVCRYIKAAGEDRAVKGLILRISSPGGTIAGSDQIYNQINRFRSEHGRPVVAFMQGLAASGGYYAAVACQRIVAEPTAITGSIGVVLGHFVFGDLLEKKLGIQPVILKSGQKKDWPSSFDLPTQEQLDYLQERLINPAYERFLDVVSRGRSDVLSTDQVRALADGGIYTAPQALDNGLIDQIGYLEDAIDLVKSMAGLEKARVVEFRQAFSLRSLLVEAMAGMSIRFDRTSLLELTTPEALYLWRAY